MDSITQTNHEKSSRVAATGYIDIHSHLLPGLDDGCQLISDSLECIRLLKEVGFAGSICTPHFLPSVYPEIMPALVAHRVELLQIELDRAGIEYRLWAGAEIRLDAETVNWMQKYGVPTLAGSHYVLIDYFGREWPKFADHTIEWLLQRGYQPILAHPERLNLPPNELARVADRVTDAGVLLQGNLASVGSGEGPSAESASHRWLAADRYTFLATDLHRPSHWPLRRRGFEVASQLAADRIRRLLREHSERIVSTESQIGELIA